MKLEALSEENEPLGVQMPIKYGKVRWPALSRPSKEAKRKGEAKALHSAIVDAAKELGIREVAGDFTRYDFHLYPRHIVALFSPSSPAYVTHSKKEPTDEARVVVPWPARQKCEATSSNEYREKPFEIIGLLMRRILDGDAAFFEDLAQVVREAKRQAREAGREKKCNARTEIHTRAGEVVADPLKYSLNADRDWFSRIAKPARKAKAPYAIWELCSRHYSNGEKPPTRLQIREHLRRKNIGFSNLSVVLRRMNLSFLAEGGRPRKT